MISDEAFFVSEGKTGSFNPPFSLIYMVVPEDDAVDTVSEAMSHDVFDLHGRIVVRDADASALQRLEKGIYTCNGRKIVIK